MSPIASLLVTVFTSLTLIVHIAIVGALLYGLVSPSFFRKIYSLLTPHRALLLSIIIAGAGVAGSFLFSEVAGFPPCSLCFVQRYLLIGVLLLLSIALYLYYTSQPERSTADIFVMYGALLLSTVGIMVSGYHTFLQAFPEVSGACLFGGEVSCSQRYFYEFGYISLPVMSLTIFVLLAASIACAHTKRGRGM